MEDIFGFYVIDSEPNTLLGWLVGPMGSQVEELDDTIISKGCMLLLRKFLGNYYDIQSPEEIVWYDSKRFCLIVVICFDFVAHVGILIHIFWALILIEI